MTIALLICFLISVTAEIVIWRMHERARRLERAERVKFLADIERIMGGRHMRVVVDRPVTISRGGDA